MNRRKLKWLALCGWVVVVAAIFLWPDDSPDTSTTKRAEATDPVSMPESDPPDPIGEEKSSQQFSAEERKAAENVAKKFVRAYVEKPKGVTPDGLVEAVRPYTVTRYRNEIRETMKVPEAKQVEEIHLYPVDPPMIVDGLTYSAVVETKDEPVTLWFSMRPSDDGTWKVVREERDL